MLVSALAAVFLLLLWLLQAGVFGKSLKLFGRGGDTGAVATLNYSECAQNGGSLTAGIPYVCTTAEGVEYPEEVAEDQLEEYTRSYENELARNGVTVYTPDQANELNRTKAIDTPGYTRYYGQQYDQEVQLYVFNTNNTSLVDTWTNRLNDLKNSPSSVYGEYVSSVSDNTHLFYLPNEVYGDIYAVERQQVRDNVILKVTNTGINTANKYDNCNQTDDAEDTNRAIIDCIKEEIENDSEITTTVELIRA